MVDLIVIGGGPAGLTAAVYAIRKRLNCLLISPDLGGKANVRMQIEGVDTFNVINGGELVRRFRNEIEYLDFARLLEKALRLEKVDDVFVVTTDSGKRLEACGDPGHGADARGSRRRAQIATSCAGYPIRPSATHRCSSTSPSRWLGPASWRFVAQPSWPRSRAR